MDEETVQEFRAALTGMTALLATEVRRRQKSNLIGAVLLAAVFTLGVTNFASAVTARHAASTAKATAMTLASQSHADAMALCRQTNAGRENLRQQAVKQADTDTAIVGMVSTILSVATAPQPNEAAAQVAAAKAFIASVAPTVSSTLDSIRANMADVATQFPDLDCTKVTP
jgi:mannose/fructose/N-acetylgalactosamine-specific phosphotransferase system component IIC